MIYLSIYLGVLIMGFPSDSMVKNPPANAEDVGLIPGLRRRCGLDPWSEKEIATHFSIFAWEIPWTEEPGRL